MSKYSPDQLRTMARTAIQARDANDLRYQQLVVTIALKLEMHPARVNAEIERLAQA